MNIEKGMLRFGIIFGLLAFPTLFRKQKNKLWLSLFLINGITNHLIDRILVRKKKLKYPKRHLPKIFKVNVTYDYLVCSYISVWFCQTTYNDKFSKILAKSFLFAVPQAAYEIFLERKTKLLHFKRGWEWYHSALLVLLVKLLSRCYLSVAKLILKKKKQ
ncbi:hypothetical protein CIB95_11385 [Lottiidibacillus patelloidae]|uniref:Uncharacterized protein n=1 Tax=Lottiidibacillus patelloidae TaxID=2670334 RepID=A0A263BRN0_9BACI|nr:CBO0543 family protein [Lottiidibacillus patelloidae]OZM56371.1 hypothetical protein CIB95_11385 [Lottiidibacillus patelloidae]